MKKYILASIIIITLVLLGIYQSRQPKLIKVDLPKAKEHQEFIKEDTEDIEEIIIIEDIIEEEVVELEEEAASIVKINNINLAVPFTSQAPTANWEQPFQDACEEASILMVDYYYSNQNLPSLKEVENILIDMVDWQKDNWGGHFNLSIIKVAEYAMTTFGYQTEVIENLTADKIRDFLDKGIPVIIPADGHKLDNPFFSGDGPEYHMLVIKGYKDNIFITNDPGTRRGADFIYTEVNLMEAIADWDKEKALTVGPKLGLILLEN